MKKFVDLIQTFFRAVILDKDIDEKITDDDFYHAIVNDPKKILPFIEKISQTESLEVLATTFLKKVYPIYSSEVTSFTKAELQTVAKLVLLKELYEALKQTENISRLFPLAENFSANYQNCKNQFLIMISKNKEFLNKPQQSGSGFHFFNSSTVRVGFFSLFVALLLNIALEKSDVDKQSKLFVSSMPIFMMLLPILFRKDQVLENKPNKMVNFQEFLIDEKELMNFLSAARNVNDLRM